jgi:methyl-accepting chemotaxis protein
MTPESAKELESITPVFQQFLIRYLDLRDSVIITELKDYLSKGNLTERIANKVYDKLAEVIVPINNKLENLENGQKDIQKSIDDLQTSIDNHELRIRILETKNK